MFYLVYNTEAEQYRNEEDLLCNANEAERYSRPFRYVDLPAGDRWVGPLAEGDK